MSNKYQMTISLNVLNHLRLSLYSNTPASACEVIANAWDADATEVHVNFNRLVDETLYERVLQEHIFDRLWLFDPAWDRATGERHMEERLQRAVAPAYREDTGARDGGGWRRAGMTA